MFSQGIYDLRHESWRSRHGDYIFNIHKPQKVHFRWFFLSVKVICSTFSKFVNVILAHNRVWDHPHGRKPYQELFFDARRASKHRCMLVSHVLRLNFWDFRNSFSKTEIRKSLFPTIIPYRETFKNTLAMSKHVVLDFQTSNQMYQQPIIVFIFLF